MARYQFKVDGRPEMAETKAIIQFVRDHFRYIQADTEYELEIEPDDFIQEPEVLTEDKDLYETKEIVFLVHRLRIKGEIEGKRDMGVEGSPVFKITQIQAIDFLGVPPATEPEAFTTELIYEIPSLLAKHLKYDGFIPPSAVQTEAHERTKSIWSLIWNSLKTFVGALISQFGEELKTPDLKSQGHKLPPKVAPSLSVPPAPAILLSRQRVTMKFEERAINTHYWYEDYDINAILKTRLQDAAEANASLAKQLQENRVHLLSATTSTAINMEGREIPELVVMVGSALKEYLGRPGTLLVPYNQGGNHWVGLMLPFNAQGKISSVNYINSLGSEDPNIEPEELKKIHGFLREHSIEMCPKNNLQLLKQADASTCGAYTIENLLLAVQAKTLEPLSNRTVRRLHLESLEKHNPAYFHNKLKPNGEEVLGFYERQRQNKPTIQEEYQKTPPRPGK